MRPARFPYAPVRQRRPLALFRLAAAAMIAAALSAAPVPGDATEGRSSVSSHIPAASADPVHRVAVIDRTDIALSGMNNVWDLLRGRLHYNSFGLYRPLLLGGRVAYLINGRRVSDSTVDLDAVPISAVERVETVRDSAAVLHGGHVIAGALNIVLRRDRGRRGPGECRAADRRRRRYRAGRRFVGRGARRGPHGLRCRCLQETGDSRRGPGLQPRQVDAGRLIRGHDGVSAGGNTVFIPVDGSAIARPIGDCRGGAYTGVLTEPLGYPGTGCGVAYADVSWSWKHRERQSMFLNLDPPLGDGMNVYVDARYAWDDTEIPRYALSVDRSSFTPSESLRQQLLQDPEIDSVPETLTAFHRCGSARGFGADRGAKHLIFRESQSQGAKFHAEPYRLAPNPRAGPHMSNRDQTSRDGPGFDSTHCFPTELQGSSPHGRPGIS